MATMRPALRVVCILIARLGTRTGMYHSLVRICPSTVESFLKVSPRAVHSLTACPRLSSNSRALPLNVALITWASWASMVRLALSEHDGAHNESLMHSCNTNQPVRTSIAHPDPLGVTCLQLCALCSICIFASLWAVDSHQGALRLSASQYGWARLGKL